MDVAANQVTDLHPRKRRTQNDEDTSDSDLNVNDPQIEAVAPAKRANTTATEIGLSMIQNRYRPDNDGPFTVHLERTSVADNTRKVSALFAGKILVRYWPHLNNHASKMRSLGASKFSLTFVDGENANKFVEGFNKKKPCIVPNEDWIAFIPNHKIFTEVVILGIDDNDSEENIINNLSPPWGWEQSWVKPKNVKRLKRRDKDPDDPTKTILKDTNVYSALFDSKLVPPTAYYFLKEVTLRPYIHKVRRCMHCQRFGHIIKYCKQDPKVPTCERCAQRGHNKNECNVQDPQCINCIRAKKQDVDHVASDNKCPCYIEQTKIKQIMAKMDLSPKEALIYFKTHGDAPRGWMRNVRPAPPTLADFIPLTPTQPGPIRKKKIRRTESLNKSLKSTGMTFETEKGVEPPPPHHIPQKVPWEVGQEDIRSSPPSVSLEQDSGTEMPCVNNKNKVQFNNDNLFTYTYTKFNHQNYSDEQNEIPVNQTYVQLNSDNNSNNRDIDLDTLVLNISAGCKAIDLNTNNFDELVAQIVRITLTQILS